MNPQFYNHPQSLRLIRLRRIPIKTPTQTAEQPKHFRDLFRLMGIFCVAALSLALAQKVYANESADQQLESMSPPADHYHPQLQRELSALNAAFVAHKAAINIKMDTVLSRLDEIDKNNKKLYKELDDKLEKENGKLRDDIREIRVGFMWPFWLTIIVFLITYLTSLWKARKTGQAG